MVPEHIKLSDEEKSKILSKYGIRVNQLPMIRVNDPAIKEMNLQLGDIIKIKRASPTAKHTEYYRVVVSG